MCEYQDGDNMNNRILKKILKEEESALFRLSFVTDDYTIYGD